MCNLYSHTKGQQAIRDFARAMRDTTGNLPPMPVQRPLPAEMLKVVASGTKADPSGE
jgi:hypothetical protein